MQLSKYCKNGVGKDKKRSKKQSETGNWREAQQPMDCALQEQSARPYDSQPSAVGPPQPCALLLGLTPFLFNAFIFLTFFGEILRVVTLGFGLQNPIREE